MFSFRRSPGRSFSSLITAAIRPFTLNPRSDGSFRLRQSAALLPSLYTIPAIR
jgi:hypothetical protein